MIELNHTIPCREKEFGMPQHDAASRITGLQTSKAATNGTNFLLFVSFVAALKRPLIFMHSGAPQAHERLR
jgi:hypothetical protein